MLSLVGGPRGGQAQGLAPEPFFLTESLRSQSRFHDPEEDSLFSHSSSVEGFRRWSTSSPSSGRNSPITQNPLSGPPPLAVPVRSSRPILTKYSPGNVANTLLSRHSDTSTLRTDPSVSSEPFYEASLPTLVTPRTVGPSGFLRRIRYAILEER
jgi:60kDa lysophospholipase